MVNTATLIGSTLGVLREYFCQFAGQNLAINLAKHFDWESNNATGDNLKSFLATYRKQPPTKTDSMSRHANKIVNFLSFLKRTLIIPTII